MKEPQLDIPILLLVFNRMDTTKRVLETIRRVRPSRLYVASDGHRADRLDEAEKVEAVRRYICSAIDWDCTVSKLFRDRNLGCRSAVSSAISWFFEHELEGIILEDDCLPDPSFFGFAESLLARYRDDDRIMAIAGNYFAGDAHAPTHSYYFSCYNHCWGWATWRRAWAHYDAEMEQWPALKETDWLMAVGDGNPTFQRYWTQIFERVSAREIDSWAYIWTFSCWAQSGISILPAHNLVSNIGFGADAANTNYVISDKANIPVREMTFPLSHPVSVVKNYGADKWTFENHFTTRFWTKVLLKLKRIKYKLSSRK